VTRDFPQVLERYRSEIEAELKSLIDMTSSLFYLMGYHLGWVDQRGQPRSGPGGKLLRPTFCLLACEAVGGSWRWALPAAAAVELVHNFSLIHDDIEDESPQRRGRPTVWQIWGQPLAINAGDAMHALGRLALLRLEERGVRPEKVLQAARLLDESCLRLCEGQHLDLCYQNRLDIEVNDYLKMISGKTATLFECSLKLGALLGADDRELVACLGYFGHNLGLAFQIRDDILGIWGQEKISGKSSVGDIQKMKKTLPIVYGLAKDKELSMIYQKQALDGNDVVSVLRILEKVGAQAYAQDMAQRYDDEALSALQSVSMPSHAKEELEGIADFILKRSY
jgi:geranylgeranyl diphosphate synthase type I